VLRQQWLVVALLAVLGLGGAAAYTYRQVPVYSAQTQLFVSVRSVDSDISQLSQGSTFTQQRVKSYSDLVTSPVIAQAVITELGLPYTPDQLSGKISATSPLDTVLLDISVVDADPNRAAAIANAVGAQFPKLIASLETPTGQVVSPVKVSITRRATVPAVPVSPRIPLNLALGLIVGLGLGIGAAVLRDQFNTTVSGVNDVERLTKAIPLGVVPYDATAGKQPLVTADQFGGRAEAFRTLRTNLQFADVDDPPRVITITSALPNEGKTTTACNVAITLAQSGARVILVEGDLRKPAVGKYLGISNAAGLTNVLAGQHELRDVIVGYQRDTLAVLPSGPTPPNPSEMLGSQQMRHLLTSLANHYDLVIIDAPPLLPVTDAAVLSAASDGAILVIRHGKSRREEVERALQALTSVNAKVLGTVLNFAPRRKRRGGYDGYGYGYGYGPTAAPEPQPEQRSSRRGKAKPAQPVAAPSRPPVVALPTDPGGIILPKEPSEAETTLVRPMPDPGPAAFRPGPQPPNGAVPPPNSVQKQLDNGRPQSNGMPPAGAASPSNGFPPSSSNGFPPHNGVPSPPTMRSTPDRTTAASANPALAPFPPNAHPNTHPNAHPNTHPGAQPTAQPMAQPGPAQPSPQPAPQPSAPGRVNGATYSNSADPAPARPAGPFARPDETTRLLDLSAEDREPMVPPQGGQTGTGVPRHHRSKRSL
jgi:capsular exopolysaccharide synthesis family protein